MMRILYNFPSRSRPEKFLKVLANITDKTRHNDYFIVCSLDEDDKTMNNDHIRSEMLKYLKVIPNWGTSKNKIDAINRGPNKFDNWDAVICVQDDVRYVKEGFDLDIIADFEKYGLDSYLHYPDGHVNDRLCTQTVMGKPYYDRFHYIYHPAYHNLCCDNEQHEVAVRLGRYHYVDTNLFVHENPIWGYGAPDDLFRHTESTMDEDKKTLMARSAKNFPIKWP